MTVGELIEALKRYDETRDVITSNGTAWMPLDRIGSIEPDGLVVAWLSPSVSIAALVAGTDEA